MMFCGCANFSRETVKDGRKVLSYMFWGSTEERQIRTELVAEFNRLNPDVYLRPIYVPAGDYSQKLETMMAAGVPPDLMMLGTEDLHKWHRHDVLLDLLPLLEHDPDLSVDDFLPQELERRTVGGKLLGINDALETMVVFYNKGLFKRFGVPLPPTDRTWSWDEFVATAKLLTRDLDGDGRVDQWGCLVHQNPMVHLPLVWSLGSDLFDPDFTTFLPKPQVFLDVVLRINALSHEHGAMASYAAYRAEGKSPTYLLETGRLAMLIWGQWYLADLAKAGFEVDLAPLPLLGRETNLLISTCYSISARTAHPEAAWQAFKYLIGEKGQVLLAATGLTLPNRRDLLFTEEGRKLWQRPGVHPPGHVQAAIETIPHGRAERTFADAGRFYYEVQQPYGSRLAKAAPAELPALVTEMASAGTELLQRMKRQREEQEGITAAPDTVDSCLASLAEVLARYRRTVVAGLLCLTALLLLSGLWVARSSRFSRRSRATITGLLFVSPAILGLLFWHLGPVLYSLFISFTSWDLLSPPRFLGLANFRELFFEDPLFLPALKATALYAVVAVPLGLSAALMVAVMLNNGVRGISLYRTIFFLPSIVPAVASAVLWLWIFNPEYGLLNAMLRGVGLPDKLVGELVWLDDPLLVMPALWLMSLWGIGGSMVIFLAGLQSIPAHLYESAELDGANWRHRFRHITLPMMSPIIFFNLVMGMIGSLQVFVAGFLMTDGGPDNATLFYVLALYRNAFKYLRMGYASAMAWVLFVIILALTLLTFKLGSKRVYYEDTGR